jgi:hypothetical protein
MNGFGLERTAWRRHHPIRVVDALPDADITGTHNPADIEVTHLDWRLDRLHPGSLFLLQEVPHEARAGLLRAAAARGAVAILSAVPLDNPPLPVVRVHDLNAAESRLAEELMGRPSAAMETIAIVGQGDAAAMLCDQLRAMLQAAGHRVGCIGPHGWSDGFQSYPSPCFEHAGAGDSALLERMYERGCTHALITLDDAELDVPLTRGMDLAAVILLPDPASSAGENSSPTPQKTLQQLARIVRRLRPGGHLIRPAAAKDLHILDASTLEARTTTYAVSRAADVSVWIEAMDLDGLALRLVGAGGGLLVPLALIGAIAAETTCAAVAYAHQSGLDGATILQGLRKVHAAPGQCEPIAITRGRAILFDERRDSTRLARTIARLEQAGARRVHLVLELDNPETQAAQRRLIDDLGSRIASVIHWAPFDGGPLTDLSWTAQETCATHGPAALHRTIEQTLPGDAVLVVGSIATSRGWLRRWADHQHPAGVMPPLHAERQWRLGA